MKISYILLLFSPMILILAGCGVAIPTISEPWEKNDPGAPDAKVPIAPVTSSGQLEFEIKKNVYCELRTAFIHLNKYKDDTYLNNHLISRKKWLPDEWGAQVALSMEVDDNGALNPSVAFINPLGIMINNTIGLGASISSTATRVDKYNSYYNIGFLRQKIAQHRICDSDDADPFAKKEGEPSRSSFLTNNLGIESWLTDALFVDDSIPSYGAPASASMASSQVFTPSSTVPKKQNGKLSPSTNVSSGASTGGPAPSAGGPGQDAVSIEIKFIVVTTGTVNPSWTLQRISADTGMTPLVSAGRTRTHDLILTIGPANAATDYANLSLQIGQAVGASNRAALTNLR